MSETLETQYREAIRDLERAAARVDLEAGVTAAEKRAGALDAMLRGTSTTLSKEEFQELESRGLEALRTLRNELGDLKSQLREPGGRERGGLLDIEI